MILYTLSTSDHMTRERASNESAQGLMSYWESVGIRWVRSDLDVACVLCPTIVVRSEIVLLNYLEAIVDDTLNQMEDWTHLLVNAIHVLIGREGPLPHCWPLNTGIVISHDEGIEVIRSLWDAGGVNDCMDTNARRCRYRKWDG